MVDWSIFNQEYPISSDGIVLALPRELAYDIAPKPDARHWDDVHYEVMKGRAGQDFLHDKAAMATIQKEFYDRMATGFQRMDDEDIEAGGVFWNKVYRLIRYDMARLKPNRLLFVGAGNCRHARMFAYLGWDVVATDISVNMLRIGKRIADSQGIRMTYVCHNAEVPFPFKSEKFDSAYSTCVINHIVDWTNYLEEKLRCMVKGGVLLERMPNAELWSFWKTQGAINEGIEIKAKHCHRQAAREQLTRLGVTGQVWTHDRILTLVPDGLSPTRDLQQIREAYWMQAIREDSLSPEVLDDGKGIYTVFRVVKPCGCDGTLTGPRSE